MNGAGKTEQGRSDSHILRRAERGDDAFASAVRHSRRVRVLKILLPAVAIFVSILFLGYSLLPMAGGSGGVGLGSASIEGGDLVMENPTLDGFTDQDLPYSMTAARARQAIGSAEGVIGLEEIRATVPIDRTNKATITAGRGTYDRENDKLTLNSGITLSTSSGMVARFTSAEVNIGSNDLITDQPVEVEMDGMRISADTFRTSDGGKTLVFEDRVRMEVDPAQVRRAQGESGESRGND